jgi:hypothetical protein
MTAPDRAASSRVPIDPRGPRFSAAITAVLLAATVYVGLAGPRLAALILLAVAAALFGWGTFAGVGRHPYGWVFKKLVRPHLAAPPELEDPTPPTFAQGMGFVITLAGLALGVAGVGLAVPVAAGFAFIAAFLNAAFGYCLGCQIYLALVRAGIAGRKRPAPAA